MTQYYLPPINSLDTPSPFVVLRNGTPSGLKICLSILFLTDEPFACILAISLYVPSRLISMAFYDAVLLVLSIVAIMVVALRVWARKIQKSSLELNDYFIVLGLVNKLP